MKRKSTGSFIGACWTAFLVAVSIHDRDPGPFTWFLVVILVLILGAGVRQRLRGD